MKPWQENLLLAVLASPVIAAVGMFRLARRARVLRQSVQAALHCGTCGADISLVGMWRCNCGFTYQGHLLRYCPICGCFPNLVRCHECGATAVVRI